jgi:hypothetical protein
MKLIIAKNKSIQDLQSAFTSEYPFLKLEFYRPANGSPVLMKKHLPYSTLLQAAGLKNGGEIEVQKEMTVEELENSFKSLFGLTVQVERKVGTLWLQTTKTDKWSLEKQNEHGRQISLPEKEAVPDRDDNDMFDF